jgi:hypothetical protein
MQSRANSKHTGRADHAKMPRGGRVGSCHVEMGNDARMNPVTDKLKIRKPLYSRTAASTGYKYVLARTYRKYSLDLSTKYYSSTQEG